MNTSTPEFFHPIVRLAMIILLLANIGFLLYVMVVNLLEPYVKARDLARNPPIRGQGPFFATATTTTTATSPVSSAVTIPFSLVATTVSTEGFHTPLLNIMRFAEDIRCSNC